MDHEHYIACPPSESVWMGSCSVSTKKMRCTMTYSSRSVAIQSLFLPWLEVAPYSHHFSLFPIPRSLPTTPQGCMEAKPNTTSFLPTPTAAYYHKVRRYPIEAIGLFSTERRSVGWSGTNPGFWKGFGASRVQHSLVSRTRKN